MAVERGRAATGALGAEYYDKVYQMGRPAYSRHYTASRYFPIWASILPKIKAKVGKPAILEPGCGVGHFAAFAMARGVRRYHGFDFSAEAIRLARIAAPSASFAVGDIRDPAAFSLRYNAAVLIEVLEHVDDDIAALGMLAEGTFVALSVPDNNTKGHVRFFPLLIDAVGHYSAIVDKTDAWTIGHWHVITGWIRHEKAVQMMRLMRRPSGR